MQTPFCSPLLKTKAVTVFKLVSLGSIGLGSDCLCKQDANNLHLEYNSILIYDETCNNSNKATTEKQWQQRCIDDSSSSTFVYLCAVFIPLEIFFTHLETSPLPLKGWNFRPMLSAYIRHWEVTVLACATYRDTVSVWRLYYAGRSSFVPETYSIMVSMISQELSLCVVTTFVCSDRDLNPALPHARQTLYHCTIAVVLVVVILHCQQFWAVFLSTMTMAQWYAESRKRSPKTAEAVVSLRVRAPSSSRHRPRTRWRSVAMMNC